MAKTAVSIILVTLLSLLLLGCRQEDEGVTVTAVLQHLTPTATTIPIITPSPTIVPTETAVATATPTIVVEPTQTITPVSPFTIDDSFGDNPFPKIPILNTNASEYRLKAPDQEILVQTLGLTMQETCNYDWENRYFEGNEVRDLFKMLEYEFDRSVEDAHENHIWFIQNIDLCLGAGYSYCIPAVIPQVLQIGLVQYLNQNQITFEDPLAWTSPEFNIRAMPIDYDEQHNEWLLEVTFVRYDLRIFVPVYEDEMGTYRLVPNEFTAQEVRGLFDREVEKGLDLTGDGLNEIIIVSRIDGDTAGGHPGFIEIFSWNGEAFYMLNTLWIGDERYGSAAFDTAYTVTDFNNDLIPDIEIIKPHYDFDSPNCNWVERHIYSWQDGEVTSDIEFLEKIEEACTSLDIEYAGMELTIESNFLVDNLIFIEGSGFLYDENIELIENFILLNTSNIQRQLLSNVELPYLTGVLERTLTRMENAGIDDQLSQLLYLLGLSYELGGDDDTAVTTYLDLIQQAPSSPWSWLAWARLEPIN